MENYGRFCVGLGCVYIFFVFSRQGIASAGGASFINTHTNLHGHGLVSGELVEGVARYNFVAADVDRIITHDAVVAEVD